MEKETGNEGPELSSYESEAMQELDNAAAELAEAYQSMKTIISNHKEWQGPDRADYAKQLARHLREDVIPELRRNGVAANL